MGWRKVDSLVEKYKDLFTKDGMLVDGSIGWIVSFDKEKLKQDKIQVIMPIVHDALMVGLDQIELNN